MVRTEYTNSPEMTLAEGKLLAEQIAASGATQGFIALYGDLGVGKTEFVRGFVSVLSPGSRVKSPSYTIVNEYLHGTVPVYHFDFYRIGDISELDGIGFDEYLAGGICIAEWCERLGDRLPPNSITVHIEKRGEHGRCITAEYPDSEDI